MNNDDIAHVKLIPWQLLRSTHWAVSESYEEPPQRQPGKNCAFERKIIENSELAVLSMSVK